MVRKFADGFPNLFVKDATRIRNQHVAFLASFQDAGSIFEQLSIIYQLPRMFVGSFTLVLPYFPTGTAERVIPMRLCNMRCCFQSLERVPAA
jgi:phosphoribosylpyrophosphate synthetase